MLHHDSFQVRDAGNLSEFSSSVNLTAGRAALGRADYHASTNLLERAAGLRPAGDERRAALLVDLSRSAYETGRVDEARSWLDEASQAADERTRSLARIEQSWVALGSGVASFDALVPLIEELIPVFERLQDDLGLARVYWSAAGIEWAACRAGETAVVARKSLHHAQRAGARDLLQEIFGMLATLHMHGPTPVAEAHAEIESQLTASSGLLLAETAQLRALGRLAAMRGEFGEARDLMRRGREPLAEAGASVTYWATAQGLAFIEEACDDLEAEERVLRDGIAHLEELGEHGFLSTNMMALAACLERQGRDDEALESVAAARDESPPGDLVNFICTDATEAVILARRGDHEAALALARSSVAGAEQTDFWRVRTMALEALGAALAASGDRDGARAAYDRALRAYERKGAAPYAERTRALLAQL
jgi:tetratricopeptide (TPR) repeat protein